MTIDTELDAAGARWRASLDADPSLDELFAASRSARRRPLWPMLAAAVVIVAVSVAAVVIGTRRGTSLVADPPAPARVHPAQCVDDFSGTLTPTPPGVPAGTTQTAEIRLRYDGAADCQVSLEITQVDLVPQGMRDVTVYDTRPRIGVRPPPVSVHPGDEFDTTLVWSSYCGAAPVTAFRMHFGDLVSGFTVATDGIAAPACVKGTISPLTVSGVLSPSQLATLHVGIRYVGGPAPGTSPDLRAGTVVVSVGTDPYRTAIVHAGERTTVVVAGLDQGGSYQVTATSGDAQCAPQTISPAPGTDADVTVVCSVR